VDRGGRRKDGKGREATVFLESFENKARVSVEPTLTRERIIRIKTRGDNVSLREDNKRYFFLTALLLHTKGGGERRKTI